MENPNTGIAEIIALDRTFDATSMTIEEIRREARERGWPGLRIDAEEFNKTGKLIVERMSRKAAYAELSGRLESL